jgi:hypothetical protein
MARIVISVGVEIIRIAGDLITLCDETDRIVALNVSRRISVGDRCQASFGVTRNREVVKPKTCTLLMSSPPAD